MVARAIAFDEQVEAEVAGLASSASSSFHLHRVHRRRCSGARRARPAGGADERRMPASLHSVSASPGSNEPSPTPDGSVGDGGGQIGHRPVPEARGGRRVRVIDGDRKAASLLRKPDQLSCGETSSRRRP